METNPITNTYHDEVTYQITKTVSWNEPGLKIVRLRLISDVGFPRWDVSYCHGQLLSGEYCDVILPFDQLLKKQKINAQLITWARKENLYIKSTGIFDHISTFNG